jgi:hypothetical protein
MLIVKDAKTSLIKFKIKELAAPSRSGFLAGLLRGRGVYLGAK